VSTWKDAAARVVNEVLAECKAEGVTFGPDISKRIEDAYPFGERSHYPYKAWRAVVNPVIAQLLNPDGFKDPQASGRIIICRRGAALLPVPPGLKPDPQLADWMKARGLVT
jgi:hypothetical protein